MTKSSWLGLSVCIPVYLTVFAGCSASVGSPSSEALEAQPDAAAPSVPASTAPKDELGIPIKICLPSACNSACAAKTGYSGGLCEDSTCVCCSSSNYPVTISAELFNLLVASQLTGINVNVENNELTVTLPSQLGGGTTQSAINLSNASIGYLNIPAMGGNWQWSMSADSDQITITTSLDATVSGSWSGIWGIGSCGVTATITHAPVTITLQNAVNYTLTGPENYLVVASVSVPLSSSNTGTDGCSLIPSDDIRGQFQSQIESGLQGQLNGQPFMSTMMDTMIQAMANDDPAALNFPTSLSPGMKWACGTWQQAALVTGGITGVCQESCN